MNDDQDYDVTYAYEPRTTGVGRLNRISGPGLPGYGVEYTRLANSDAVEYARYKDAEQGDPLAETHRMYETARDLIDYVENSAGSPSATVSKYDYASDVLGRRTRVDLTGPAFSATGNHHVQFGYNDRSELTAADRYQGNGTSPPYTHLTQDQHEFDYVYDLIGNRLTYAMDGSGASYCTNALNQYTDIGSAITCPPSTPTLGYDLDGNLTSDGTLVYEWDAENRLIRVVPASLPAEGDKKLEFAYDYMNRRVRKQVFAWNTNTQTWNTTPESDLRIVYDQWNVVMVLDGQDSNATKTKYTWGLDLSGLASQSPERERAGGIHGAGGIGGLLAAEETAAQSSPSYWFLYDGNGNVGQVIRASDQSIAARYEYDPYGNTLVAEGTYAAANPFRFSTKPFDAEIGFGNWGKRYLDFLRGRWANRDPIDELGGHSLYDYVSNDPIGSIDRLGLIKLDCALCLAALVGKAAGVAGCANCYLEDPPPGYSTGQCISDCASQYFKPCELWEHFKNHKAEWLGAAACVSCGVRLIAEAMKPEPPPDCKDCPKPSPPKACHCYCTRKVGPGDRWSIPSYEGLLSIGTCLYNTMPGETCYCAEAGPN